MLCCHGLTIYYWRNVFSFVQKVFRYWFVLVEDSSQVALVYFKTEDAYIARQRNEGFIRMDEAQISVVGEHLGHKNAFLAKTPKGEYHLLPESRYTRTSVLMSSLRFSWHV